MKSLNIHKVSKDELKYFVDGVLNSYSQIFFSTHRLFAILVILVTFIDFYTGLAGFIAVLITQLASYLLNLHRPTIAKGLFGFNGLLVGLGLGMYYSLSWHLVFIVILAAIFTLFISVSLQGVIGKYELPYLSIPFLVGIWIFTLATRHFEALGISERGIYTLNELYVVGGHQLVKVYENFNAISLPPVLKSYFISLSAILFQYNVLAGMIIAVGLIFFSRIAFMLSLLGFAIAFSFYQSIDANITLIDYSYIGFNYILTAIAIGGFFLIPSVRSFFSVAVLVPLVAILSISLNTILLHFHLAIYSLPFNVVVLLFLYVLKYRMDYSPKLAEVYYQFNSPEKNLYTFVNYEQRFQFLNYQSIQLPFMGVWSVSQGHDGEYTHQNQWRHAWDFIINDEEGRQYTNDGYVAEDYYCYNKPVCACGDGVVEEVVNHINDNAIGDVNLEHNWGNCIIIKHADNVFSNMSHLKKASVTVKKGDTVKAGQVIGKCGNSGRSPYPHLHFQIQHLPYIGAPTISYPINNYLKYDGKESTIKALQIPLQEEKVSNSENCELVNNAYHFVPGQMIRFEVSGHDAIQKAEWEVKINAINQTYLYCTQSGAKAYFDTSGNQFYFSQYEGSRRNLLYDFYLGNFKIQKSFYANHLIEDSIPLHISFPARYLWWHDFIAPFVQLAHSKYTLHYASANDVMNPTQIKLSSEVENTIGHKSIEKMTFEMELEAKGIAQFMIRTEKKTITLRRMD